MRYLSSCMKMLYSIILRLEKRIHDNDKPKIEGCRLILKLCLLLFS